LRPQITCRQNHGPKKPRTTDTSTPAPPYLTSIPPTTPSPSLPFSKKTKMVLRIRLARFGRKHAPIYNIVVAHARTARNSRPLEVLGTYNPIPQAPRPGDTHGRPWKDIKLDTSRARYWVGVGAQPSNTAWRLLSMVCDEMRRRGADWRIATRRD
jgi:ribosomal protein S16